MRELTTDQIWDYTKRMWKWVAFQKVVLKDPRSVTELKHVWLKENEPEFRGIDLGCFFCEVAGGCDRCDRCPGRAVDPGFTCRDFGSPHHYNRRPGAFYREILRLDEIRTAKPVEKAIN